MSPGLDRKRLVVETGFRPPPLAELDGNRLCGNKAEAEQSEST